MAPEIEFFDTYGIEGQEAILECNVPLAIPRAVIKWKLSDTQVFLDELIDSKYKIINNLKDSSSEYETRSKLVIKKVTKSDKSKYVCVAINKLAISQHEASLIIEYKPELPQNLKTDDRYFSWSLMNLDPSYLESNDSVSYTDNAFLPVEFVCLTQGEPAPFVSWYFKDKKINIDNFKYKILKNTSYYSKLEVNPKTLDDFGDYKCLSQNKHGKVEKLFHLKFLAKPSFTPLINEKIINSDSLIVEIKQNFTEVTEEASEVDGYQIQWTETNSNWSNPNEIIFNLKSNDLAEPMIYTEINNLVPDTEYKFRSAAINKAGVSDLVSNEIKIRTKLKPVTRIVLVSMVFASLFVFLIFGCLMYYLISTLIITVKNRPKYKKLIVRV